MFEHKIFTMELAGRELSVEIGKIAQLASGSAILKYGETMVMVNVSKSAEPREGVDFFPLSVDYEEKLYSVGKIPGGFLKREGKASEKATLTSRLIDRPIRPLFPKGFRNDVQVVATVLSVDHDCTPDVVAMIGSSVALSISEIPFNGPTGSVNVGLVDGALVINPTAEQREKSSLHLTVSGTKDAVMMVEAGADEVPESLMLEAILTAHEEIKKIVAFIEEIVAEVGKEKMEFIEPKADEDIEAKVRELATDKMKEAVRVIEKLERQEAMDAVKNEVLDSFDEEALEEFGGDIVAVLDKIIKEEVRKIVKSTDALIALDEAYMEFGDESLIDEVMNYDNLLIVKTLSKAFSLAGIRMGYIVANEDIINSIEKVRAPYNLNSLSTYIATEALRQKDRMYDYVKSIKEEREKMYKTLIDLGVKAYKSSANFIFFKSDIEDLQKKLIQKDVLIRKFSSKLEGFYRVSIGTKEQNQKFLEALKEVI